MGTSDTAPTSEELSVFHAPRPFKAAAFVERASGSTKRNKTLKQILNMERDAQLQRLGVDKKRKEAKRRRTTEETAAEPEAAATPASPTDEGAERRMVPTYTSVEAPPSLLPAKRYCDITGLQVRGQLTQAPYTDPKTRLRYHSAEIYDIVKGFAPGVDNAYLALRGSASQLM
ncbi:chromatin-remodeling complex subunit ies6 [Malassezia brasiliensis]|uniref:Chromatin-remodeling complex subunit ies6 n=1 Tax=Malassezia brasiliensis TaxID=1821822 RepID=A0AAF0IUR0_9BASI|nr:chromatin-remodeling complex subunit ies6 [Malassezia brasiliensis]